MAQTQSAQGPSDPDANGGGMPDVPEMWGNGGMVGDGRYRLTHRLGRGGMAEVFAAEDVRLGRTVAVKLLRADLAEDPVSKARFTREAQSVAGLNHHAVVAVYDSGEDIVGRQTVPYIVMELVEGRTIRDLLLNAEAPPPEQALIIVSGVLEALAYSHQHGIVHRDIKPANVIITNNGAVKVMDFGIARALHGAASTMTQTGMVMGTPQYLSPEQALGKTVDARSDLYATGCLLYELLALRPPFTGETPLSVVYQHVQDNPIPPSQVLDAVPPELDGLVMRSLAKDPDDRFQSAEEMRGLVQYSLQMLHEAGGHTGAWDTGQVPAAAATQVMGGAGLGQTTAMPHPQHGNTSPQRILPQGMGGGGDDDYAPAGHGRGGGGNRGKLVLIVALIAVVLVSVVAYQKMNGKGDAKEDSDTKKPTHSTSQSSDPSKSSSPKQNEKSSSPEKNTSTGGVYEDDDDSSSTSTGGTRDRYTKPPTDDKSKEPTTDPTDDKTPDDPKPGNNTSTGTNSNGTPGTSNNSNTATNGTPGTSSDNNAANNPATTNNPNGSVAGNSNTTGTTP